MGIVTKRLVIRHAVEADRARLVELFTDAEFTVYSDSHDRASANARVDRMLHMIDIVAYAKQPIVERASGTIVGYTGADSVRLDGIDRLEWGWRLAPAARGCGFGTEAAAALLAVADRVDNGEMLCLIHPNNRASRRVADKLGFQWSRRLNWRDDPTRPSDVLLRPIGAGGAPLTVGCAGWTLR